MNRAFNLPDAIAREEGWYALPRSRARRNNNPGNIEFADWTKEFGATLEDALDGRQARFACFPSPGQGFGALRALLGFPRYKGHTLADAIAAWAPPVENQTSEYLKNICAWTGMTPETVIDGFLGDANDDPR